MSANQPFQSDYGTTVQNVQSRLRCAVPPAVNRHARFVSCLTFAFSLAVAHADSFVQNADERARIEQALPVKAVVQPLKPRRLLIFTLNVGYGGHPSIAHANEAFTLMGKKTGAFETTVNSDPAVFQRDSLKQFDAACDTPIRTSSTYDP